MEEMIEKWAYAREMQGQWEKKSEEYKNKVREIMIREDRQVHETEMYTIQRTTQQREIMSKKTTPADVWTKYALPQRIECITLKKRKKKSEKMNMNKNKNTQRE
jgi:hypothetical protein